MRISDWSSDVCSSDLAQDWLGEKAGLADYIVDALTATESRPRCEAAGTGAFINLRGNVADKAALPDALASVRIWASGPRVFSAMRQPLTALDPVVASIDAGENGDPGDLIAKFAIGRASCREKGGQHV